MRTDLLTDWVGNRDKETYVSLREMERLGWEEFMEDSSYSSFFDSSKELVDVIGRSYRTAKGFLDLMGFEKPVSLKISGSDSMTNGNVVYVSTDVYDDKELSIGEKQDIFIGLTLHEGSHVLYTEFEKIVFIDGNRLKKNLFNIIEDERIERLLAADKPGYANFIEKTKKFYFDKIISFKCKNPVQEIMSLFLYLIRYPKNITWKDVEPFEEILGRIKDVVTPYPTTTRNSSICAKDIYDILREVYEEDAKKEENEEENEDEEGDGGGKEGSVWKTIEKQAGELLDTLDKNALLKTAYSAIRSDMAKEVSKELEERIKEVEKNELDSEDSSVGFSTPNTNMEVYMNSYNRICSYIPAVSKILKIRSEEVKLVMKSVKSGYFDTSKLAEAYQGVPTVFMRDIKVKTEKSTVCVLIDESGSMCGRKILMARDAAVLINESIGKLNNVELFIYGHTADNREHYATSIHVYKEKNKWDKFVLGGVKAHNNNRDGTAIYETALRVRKFTKEPVLFFVLSDGLPQAYRYEGAFAVKHTKDMVMKVEKMGFTVMQIYMEDTSVSPSEMFSKYEVIADISEFPLKLANIIKKAILNKR